MRFEEYADTQSPALLRLAYLLTNDAQLAEDLVQTVLLHSFRRWRQVSRARSPEAYARRMLVNAHLDWHRRHSSTERPTDLSHWEPRGAEPDPADGVAERDRLRHALEPLPPRTRTALVLRYYSGLDDASIAETLGITASSVRSTIARGLAALRASDISDDFQDVP